MKALRNYLISFILLLSVLSVYIPIHYHVPYPKEVGPQFDPHIRRTYIDLLDARQPDVMLLGDSMLGQAVDDMAVANQLHKRVLLVSLPGTASTIWYVIIKSNIVVAEHKPKYLAIFFRDAMMTVPGYRVTGRYFEQIDEFATPDDKLLIQRAYINQMNLSEKIMERYFPLYGSRWTIRQTMDYYIRYFLGKALLHCNSSCMDYAMQDVLQTGNLDLAFLGDAITTSDEYMYTDERLNFTEQISKSFLPEIIRLCKENGIQLILVRMPILTFAKPGSAPEGLNPYIQNLSAYLKENGIPFFDFDQQEFTTEYFSDALHLNPKGQAVFTPKLVESLKNVIK